MTNEAGGYTPLVQLVGEICTARDAGATIAALAMVYIGLDTLALLTCPIGQKEQNSSDFVAWIDKYLKADAASEYQYEGIDVYAARCAALHSYGSVAARHSKPNPPRKFGYMDNGLHKKDDADRFALISVAVLIKDFRKAMEKFINEMMIDPELKQRVDSRMASLFFTSLIDH